MFTKKILLMFLQTFAILISVHHSSAASSTDSVDQVDEASGSNYSMPAVEIPILKTLAGEESPIVIERDGDYFILRDGRKMGKISINEIDRISNTELSETDRLCEVIPLGELLAHQLFVKLLGTEDKNLFTVISLPSPIEELENLLYDKIRPYYSIMSSFDLLDEKKEIAEYIFDDPDFIKKYLSLLENVYNLYGDYLPCDMTSYESFIRIVINLNNLLKKNLELPIIAKQINQFRSIIFNGIIIEFRYFELKVLHIERFDDNMRLRISIPAQTDREYFLDINKSDILSSWIKKSIPLCPANFEDQNELPIYLRYKRTTNRRIGNSSIKKVYFWQEEAQVVL